MPIYCMSKVRGGGTVDNAAAISKQMIEEFRYRQLDWHRAVRPLRAVAKIGCAILVKLFPPTKPSPMASPPLPNIPQKVRCC